MLEYFYMLEEKFLELFAFGNIFSWTVVDVSHYTHFDNEDRKKNVT